MRIIREASFKICTVLVMACVKATEMYSYFLGSALKVKTYNVYAKLTQRYNLQTAYMH